MKIIMATFLIAGFSLSALAWDGTDQDSGTGITVESGNLVRHGNSIEIYDHDTGDTHDVDVESVNSSTLEVYDHNAGESRTFDMD